MAIGGTDNNNIPWKISLYFPGVLKHQQTSVSFLPSMQEENLDTVGMETWETKTNSLFGEGGVICFILLLG